jgi:hypothetical protein
MTIFGFWGLDSDPAMATTLDVVLEGPGFIAGRFNDPIAGPGAILVTHADHVIVCSTP